MPKLIAISGGHDITTPGKETPVFPDTGKRIKENEFNDAVVYLLIPMLLGAGFRVLDVSPERGTDTPLDTRIDRANSAKADLYLSVHANAKEGIWGDWGGIETYVHSKSPEGKRIGGIIHKSLLKGTKLRDRGVKHNDLLKEIYKTKMPAVLVECGFMDNLYEAQLLRSAAYRLECATELFEGICEAFGVKVTTKAPATPAPVPASKIAVLHERYAGTDVAFIKLPKGRLRAKFVYAKGKKVSQLVKEHKADFGINFPFFWDGQMLGDAHDNDKAISAAYGKMLKWHEFAVTDDGLPKIGQLKWTDLYALMLQGAPLLNENGKPVYDFYAKHQEVQDDVAKSRAQRTVLSVDTEGNLLITVSGGRQGSSNPGWTLAEASTYHLRKGALWTLNGDGGGSSVLADQSGVLTQNSGADERIVHHAVLFYLVDGEDEYMMKKADADKLINLLKSVYAIVPDKEVGRLADELRKASGQPTENS